MALGFTIILLLGCHALVQGIVNVCPADLNIDVEDATMEDLKRGAVLIKTTALSKFEIPHESEHVNKKVSEKVKNQLPAERQKSALCTYFSSIAACTDAGKKCKICELVFIAYQLSLGDPHCYFLCRYEDAVKNVDKLPTDKTFETYISTGAKLKDEGKTDEQFKALVKRGAAMAGLNEKKNKRIFGTLAALLIGVMVAKFVVFVGANVAVGYITKNGNNPNTGMGSKAAKIAMPVARAGCFVDTAIVNIYRGDGIKEKTLADLNVGDMVESIDEVSGKRTFSPVYYVAHVNQTRKSLLLNIYYQDGDQTKKIGLSGNHLIYASKGKPDNAPLTGPIRADDVKAGDHVWIMDSGRLVAKKVVDIVPFFGGIRHPLTENHHIIVDGVHASVHILNENLYRGLTVPLRFTYWLNPEWNNGFIVNKLVRLVESLKEPIFSDKLARVIGQFSVFGESMM